MNDSQPIKIDKDIPIPEKTRYAGRTRKYPFNIMQVGDSFLTPYNEGEAPILLHKRLSAAWYKYAQKHGDVAFIGKQEATGVRVWRTK
jgi:hypothetical protein